MLAGSTNPKAPSETLLVLLFVVTLQFPVPQPDGGSAAVCGRAGVLDARLQRRISSSQKCFQQSLHHSDECGCHTDPGVSSDPSIKLISDAATGLKSKSVALKSR